MQSPAADMREIQVLLDGRCSDSRDRGGTESEAARTIQELYVEAGTLIVRASVLSAGTFATKNFIYSLLTEIHENRREAAMYFPTWAFREEAPDGFVPLRTVVRMTTHTSVAPKEGVPEGKDIYGKNELAITMGTSIGCGMESANTVWRELMGFLKGKLSVTVGGRALQVMDYEDVLRMLWEFYGFDGENPLRFIKSIDDHRMHVTEQASKVRNVLSSDHQLRRTMVDVIEGIVNYGTGRVYRVDKNEGLWSGHDDITALTANVLANLPEDHPEKARRVAKQRPEAMLICPPSVPHPRRTLTEYLASQGGHTAPIAAPGSVFTVSGHDVLGETYTFGPYDIVGTFYAAAHLNVKDVYLIGHDESELRLMELKIRQDPIVNLIRKEFGLRVHKITLENANGHGRDSIPPRADKQFEEAYREGLRALARNLNPKSVLNRLPAERLRRLRSDGC
ncbi:MAG: hypothetical protein PHY95_03710 [Candidatus ainarchaeum sp.]|nr:hypothetical protein [Candidatus ainarchaeum sp.]